MHKNMPDFNSKVKSHINHSRTEENFVGISCPNHRERRIVSLIKNSQVIVVHGKSAFRQNRKAWKIRRLWEQKGSLHSRFWMKHLPAESKDPAQLRKCTVKIPDIESIFL